MTAVKRILYILIALILTSTFLVGCEPSNERKIAELQEKIAELEEANRNNQIYINSWQNKYNDAKEMYDRTMSMDNPEQRQLDYAKENMDEATREIHALERKIALNDLEIKNYKKQIEKLQN